MSTYSFEVDYAQVQARMDEFIGNIFATLESEFLVLPKGDGFIAYEAFERGYEALKRATSSFVTVTPEVIQPVAFDSPVVLVVLRAILGFTPPEWGYMATRRTGIDVGQEWARGIDRRGRVGAFTKLVKRRETVERVGALVQAACAMLAEGAPDVEADKIHRLDKADTKHGLESLRPLAQMGVPYAMLLYERIMGRPFAGHKDSVSDLVGAKLEVSIEEILDAYGISKRKVKRAETIAGFAQNPDFIVPDEFAPLVLIEAKISEDDGTARDKVNRVEKLAQMSVEWERAGKPPCEVIACIAGRGFGIRRERMKTLLEATKGKVFTPRTLERLVSCTSLARFKTKEPPAEPQETVEAVEQELEELEARTAPESERQTDPDAIDAG